VAQTRVWRRHAEASPMNKPCPIVQLFDEMSISGWYDEEYDVFVTGTGQIIRWLHHKSNCEGRPCVIHNQSDHHMRNWPTHWRNDRKIMERLCPHGIGHPDPDDITTDTVHGCDGCCSPPLDIEMQMDGAHRAIDKAMEEKA